MAEKKDETRKEKQKEVEIQLGVWCNPASLWAPVRND